MEKRTRALTVGYLHLIRSIYDKFALKIDPLKFDPSFLSFFRLEKASG